MLQTMRIICQRIEKSSNLCEKSRIMVKELSKYGKVTKSAANVE